MSGRETAVIAGNAVTNRGLIDGATTYVNAKLIDNLGTGRIYGNDVALAAETLRNDSESGKSASIMARNRLDIGVSKLVNAELSNIYSAGNIAIGGSLTEERKAVGRAQAVDNISATIESLGDMAIATNSLSNRNTHFSTKDVVLSTESFVQYQGPGRLTSIAAVPTTSMYGTAFIGFVLRMGAGTTPIATNIPVLPAKPR